MCFILSAYTLQLHVCDQNAGFYSYHHKKISKEIQLMQGRLNECTAQGAKGRVKWGAQLLRGPTKMQINYSQIFYFTILAAVGEREAMNCLEQDASKAASRDLTAAQSTSLIAMFARVTNCMKVEGLCPPTFRFGGARAPLAPPLFRRLCTG